MYLEFTLPTGAAGMAAGMTKMGILKRLRELSELHHFDYTSSTVGYRLCVELTRPSDYSLFALVWNSESHYWRQYKLRKGTMPKVGAE